MLTGLLRRIRWYTVGLLLAVALAFGGGLTWIVLSFTMGGDLNDFPAWLLRIFGLTLIGCGGLLVWVVGRTCRTVSINSAV